MTLLTPRHPDQGVWVDDTTVAVMKGSASDNVTPELLSLTSAQPQQLAPWPGLPPSARATARTRSSDSPRKGSSSGWATAGRPSSRAPSTRPSPADPAPRPSARLYIREQRLPRRRRRSGLPTRWPPRRPVHAEADASERASPDASRFPPPPASPGAAPDLAPVAPTAARHRGDYLRPLSRIADRTAAAGIELLALAAPVDCVCCGAEDLALCGACERQVRLLTLEPFRAEGQAPALMDMDGSVILPVVAAGAYRGELAQAVLSFKRHGQGRLADVLAQGTGPRPRRRGGRAQALCLVPVPTSSAAFRKRGFSPVHLLLASSAAGGLPGLTVVDALRKARGPAGRRVRTRWAAARRAWPAGTGPARPRVDAGPGPARVRRPSGDVLHHRRRRAHHGRHACRSRPCPAEAGAVVRGAVVLAATRPPVRSDLAGLPAGAECDKEKNKPEKDE